MMIFMLKKEFVFAEASFATGETSSRSGEERGRLLMYSFEIYNELVKDLIASRGALSGEELLLLLCLS